MKKQVNKMGVSMHYNWILKMDKSEIPSLIESGKLERFLKTGHRIFPCDKEIFLADEEFTPHARIKIRHIDYGNGVTSGTYEIIKELDDNQKKVMGDILREMYSEK